MPPTNPGLCQACRHAATVSGARSTFWICLRSRDDPRFPRYPRLPVLRCRGFEPAGEGQGTGDPSRSD